MNELETYQTIRDELSKIKDSDRIYGPLYRQYRKNMIRVYPNRSPDIILSDFRRTLFYQRLAYKQQQTPIKWAESIGASLPSSLTERPGIIVTAHTYSYRNIVRYLAQNGLPLCLLIARRVYDKQQKEFEGIMKNIYGDQFETSFRLVEAEDPTALLKLRRAFNDGLYILGYLDGNTGSAARDSLNNLQLVRFGSTYMWVRIGLFRIAQWLGCSLHWVWTKTDEDYKSLYNFQRLRYKLTKENLEHAVKDVYASLEVEVRTDPAQWECFLYLEEFFCKESEE